MRKGQPERMSKLQKLILKELYKSKSGKVDKSMNYDDFKRNISHNLGDAEVKDGVFGLSIYRSSKSFNVIFVNSIGNLARKGYIKLIYTCEDQQSQWRYNTCERKPKEEFADRIEICDDCHILSKRYRISYAFRDDEEEKCYFNVVIRDRKGEPSKGSHIKSVSLTEKGKRYNKIPPLTSLDKKIIKSILDQLGEGSVNHIDFSTNLYFMLEKKFKNVDNEELWQQIHVMINRLERDGTLDRDADGYISIS